MAHMLSWMYGMRVISAVSSMSHCDFTSNPSSRYLLADPWDVYQIKLITTSADHSDPSGLYSYRNQPSRVLFALDKLVAALAPLIGYEAAHSTIAMSGWSDGASKEDVQKWEGKGLELMEGWDEEYWRVEREGERAGCLKVRKSCFRGFRSIADGWL